MPMDPQIDVPMRSALALLGLAILVLLAISASWAVAVERLWSGRPLVPIRRSRPASWGGLEVFLCFLAWQGATLVASWVLSSRRGEGGELNLVDAISAVALVNTALIIILPMLLMIVGRASLADLGFRRETLLPDLATGIIAAFCFVPLVYAVQFSAVLIWKPTAHPLQEMMVERPSLAVMMLGLVSAVVLAPAAEELMFRGILQGWLEKRLAPPTPEASPRLEDAGDLAYLDVPAEPGAAPSPVGQSGSRAALVVPAALFAGVHFGQWPAPIPLFVLALGLGVLYRRTGGLVAPIAMHATFNGLSTAAMIAVLLLVPDAAREAVEQEVPVPPVPPAAADREGDEPPELREEMPVDGVG